MIGEPWLTSNCGAVTITTEGATIWHVYIYDWHAATHVNEVKAVMHLQRLTLERKPIDDILERYLTNQSTIANLMK